MISVYAKCSVPKSNTEKFIKEATELVARSREEEGNVSYNLIRDIDNPAVFAFLEMWESKEVLDKHMRTKHFINFGKNLDELIDSPMSIAVHTIII